VRGRWLEVEVEGRERSASVELQLRGRRRLSAPSTDAADARPADPVAR